MKKQTKTLKHPKVNAKTRADYRKALTKFSNDCNKSIKWWLMSKFTNGTANATALSKEFSKLSNYWISRSQAVLKIPVQKMLNKTLNLSDNFFKKQGIKFDNKTKSHDLRNTLNAELNSNLALIKSIPRETILRYESVLYQAINNFDEQSIVKQLKTISGISERRAKFIARDQTAKAQEALTLARGKDLGFEYYEWITAGDERVSGTPGGKYPVPKKGGHYHLDGRIYKIGEPTAIIDSYGTLGKPSQRPNCRCTAALIYLEPNQDLKLIKDSKHGDYYELVNKIDGKPVNPPKPKAKPKTEPKQEKPKAKPKRAKRESLKIKKKFIPLMVSEQERTAIENWSGSNHILMSQIAEGKNINELGRLNVATGKWQKVNLSKEAFEAMKKEAQTFENLIDNFAGNAEPGKKLYRGINLTPSKFDELFGDLEKGSKFVLNKKRTQSFTPRLNLAAYRFADDILAPDSNIRVVIMTKSTGNELDISQFTHSSVKFEKEHLIKKGKIFEVKNIKKATGKDGKKWVFINTEQKGG